MSQLLIVKVVDIKENGGVEWLVGCLAQKERDTKPKTGIILCRKMSYIKMVRDLLIFWVIGVVPEMRTIFFYVISDSTILEYLAVPLCMFLYIFCQLFTNFFEPPHQRNLFSYFLYYLFRLSTPFLSLSLLFHH